MAARTLDAIIAELGSTYNPQVDNLRRQQSLIPQEVTDQENQLRAQEQDYYDTTIMGDARRRGLGFSGIPIGERAKYGATQFLPALARVRSEGRQRAASLEDSILGVLERRNTAAQGIYQNELNLAEQQRQFNENLAAQREQARRASAAAAASAPRPSFGGVQGAQTTGAGIARKQDGGFAFTDAAGRAISAAQYAQQNGQDIRDVLYQMGQAGDQYAARVYNQLAQDQFFGRGNTNYDKKIYQTYSPLFWGIG